jgi:hypothetical protein
MNSSQTIDLLAAALVKAHAEINGVVKSATNPFFKSKYATLEAVVEAVKPALLKQGIVVVQGLQDAENGVGIETMLLHTSGQWISSTLRLPASKEDAQGYGSACTYGRRYGLMAICGVPAEDDDGNAATASAPAPSRITPVAGSLAALSAEDQEFCREHAADIVDKWNNDKCYSAYELFYEANLSNEIKLGVWECLQPNSKVRNGIKKIADENKRKAAA